MTQRPAPDRIEEIRDEHAKSWTPTKRCRGDLLAEIDALRAERDKLRASISLFVEHADGMNAAGARAAGDSLDAIAPGVGEYLEAQREALGIWADEFRDLLPKEEP